MFTLNFPIVFNRFVKIHACNFTRALHTCGCLQKSHLENREAKFMVKIMKGTKNPKKRHWFNNGPESKGSAVTAYNNAQTLETSGGGKPNARRRMVLNKLYMRHITEQMSSDELTSGRGIQITKIQVSEDLRVIHVYWLCDAAVPGGAFLPTLLDSYAHKLRHNLSQLSIVGSVPPIKFISDKQRALGVNVDRVLMNADFGDEADKPQRRPEWMQETPEKWDNADLLPPMRNDVLGLDQSEMMSKVKRVLKKTSLKDIHVDTMTHIDSINAEIAKFREQNIKPKDKRHRYSNIEQYTAQPDWIEQLDDEDYADDEEPGIHKK